MIRTLLEMQISSRVEDGRPLPRWLAWLAERDARLGRFFQESQQLDDLLRSSAAERRATLAGEAAVPTLTLPPEREANLQTQRSSSLVWLSAAAVAAALLIGINLYRAQPSVPPTHAGEFSQQLTVLPGEVLRLLNSAAKSSQAELPKLTTLARGSLPTRDDWQQIGTQLDSPVRAEIDQWRSSWERLRTSLLPETPET